MIGDISSCTAIIWTQMEIFFFAPPCGLSHSLANLTSRRAFKTDVSLRLFSRITFPPRIGAELLREQSGHRVFLV
jgi:hypothetical protein